jgi:DNA-binding NtrC family response regulator
MESPPQERPAPQKRPLDPEHFPTIQDFREQALADLERMYFNDLMSLCSRNIAKACEVSGLSRARLYALLKKYGISR